MRKLQIVPLSRMEEMRKYFNEYLTELAQFDTGIEFDERGTPKYEWFDCYWSDSGRYPIFLVIDGEVAGLTLIREIDNMLYEIAEFYVRPEFRK